MIFELSKFEEVVGFYVAGGTRLFVPLEVMLKYMRNLVIYLGQRGLVGKEFTLEDLKDFGQF